MEKDIDNLIINLKLALIKKYGENFKRFYLTRGLDNTPWEGLISSSDEKGNRNAEYYSIDGGKIVKDDNLI